MANEEQVPCYIARCLCGCGGLKFAAADVPDCRKDNANEIAKLVRRGYTIERMNVGDVRMAKWGCANESTSI